MTRKPGRRGKLCEATLKFRRIDMPAYNASHIFDRRIRREIVIEAKLLNFGCQNLAVPAFHLGFLRIPIIDEQRPKHCGQDLREGDCVVDFQPPSETEKHALSGGICLVSGC
ncbi:hypothetical protein AX761_01175 [Rhizobium sp. 58]|nr:hypothetical protein AX761_01175 [Rhizobium sp. 58]